MVLSSVVNTQQMLLSKYNANGRVVFGNSTLNKGYTADAQLAQIPNTDNVILAHHNRQDVSGHEAKEYLLNIKDRNTIVNTFLRNNTLYQKSSIVPLKNGKIFVAGLHYVSSFGATTWIDANIYDPSTNRFGSGVSFTAYSKYLSCFEQKDNEVLCAYVSYDGTFVSKLKIKHLHVNTNSFTLKDYEVVKNFYTEYNFLKAVSFDGDDTLIVFQTGNTKDYPKYGNKGHNLFYYHLHVDLASDDITIKRYSFIYPNCAYREDPEDYTVDIAVLSPYRVYIVCETDTDRFKGFFINPTKSEIEEFNFNNFLAEKVKNPVFAKFGQSLGIFYTHISVNYNKRVAYHIMNYPDCHDYKNYHMLLPRGFSKVIDLDGKVFLNNPYPDISANTEIRYRFSSISNITIKNANNNSKIEQNIDYSPSTKLSFMTKQLTGDYSIEMIATRMDPTDGLILGRKCFIKFNTPECLEQCESCTQKGTEEHHYCLGCKEGGAYYEEPDPTAVNEGYGRPHFCRKCDIACSTCWGAFQFVPIPTTNCKLCDYKNNYFHLEEDNRTCISNETKEYWEGVLGSAIFLDKTPGPDKKEEWRWRRCHSNCAECFEKGDDIDNKCNKCKNGLYFFCNQTVGHGIPGSCHSDCQNNGFYVTVEEEREKCCPCLENCKECQNATMCDKCYRPFFLTPDHRLCNKSCGYCLAEDKELGECVNCKTRYRTPMYTLNKTCVDEIPFIEFLQRYHHIVDDQCNLLIGCKEGCYKCNPWYSDRCESCESNYYKEDFHGVTPQPTTFRCFNKTTCQGVTPYKYDEKLRIGGVPILDGSENVCLNCKLRNNSYRLPENKFYCSNKISRTYVDIDEYNKLSYCYLRCQSCDYWGNALVMNCSKCRDYPYYEPLVIYGNYSNCYHKGHKCGIFPYYHDYDLYEVMGKEEDDCNEDCDVCLYNFTCPEKRPFFVFETHECVDYCGVDELIKGGCSLNNSMAGILLLENPFGLKNPYDLLNTSLSMKEIISSKLFEYVANIYGIDVTQTKNEINNYIGNGKIYNLPQSQIILGNNISIELTSVSLEMEKIAKLLQGDTSFNKNNISTIDLSQCQEILRQKYNLSSQEDLIVLKGDLLSKLSELYLSNQIEYQIFSTSIGAFLPLAPCKEQGVTTQVYNFFDTGRLLGENQYKLGSIIDSGYNAFDINSDFYNDICTPFTNENGNDVLLDERRTDYFNENYNLCENKCTFIGYDEKIKMYTCNCPIKTTINGKEETTYEAKPMEIPDDFFKKNAGYSNIKVFKCASQVFSSEGQKKNFGSYILLTCLTSFVGIVIFYFVKGKKILPEEMRKLEKNNSKNNKKKSQIANPPKGDKVNEVKDKNPEILDYDIPLKKEEPTKVIKDIIYNDEELNSVNYKEALLNDKRSFIQYYWSLLKLKQLLLFTFYTHTDHTLRFIKIALFILFLSFYFAFTALFFNDSIMRAIYIYKGNTDAAVHVTNIVLSSLCCLIMNYIVRYITLSEKDISEIISEKNVEDRSKKISKTLQCIQIKLIIFFSISILLIGLCWYYVSAFCAIFKNSQGHYFINVLVAFIVCNIWPCVTSLFAPILRIKSLKDGNREGMYKASKILAYF